MEEQTEVIKILNKDNLIIEKNNQNNRNSVDSEQSPTIPIEYIEPQTHVKGKGSIERFFGSCLKQDFDLSNKEIRSFVELKVQCNKKFDAKRKSHNKLVQNLWFMWKGENIEVESIDNEEWKKFGFQQKNPRTDFRGAGVTGLKHLIYFFEQNKDFVEKQMIKEENEFIFAVCSINVTFFLMKYFQLLDFLEFEKDRKEMAGRKAFKSFCKFLSEDPIFMFNLQGVVLKDLFYTWIDMKKNDKKVTLLDFGRAQEINKTKVKRYFSSQEYKNFDEFKDKFLGSM